MTYEIAKNFLKVNRTYITFIPIGMVLHETATPNATDENEVQCYNTHNMHADVHGFIDYDSITQTAPWNEKVNGAGPSANIRFIQIELCHFDGARFQEVWNRGVWLFAWVFVNVLKICTVTKDNLMSHKEVSEKWHETNHTDPYGFFADNGKTVDEFRSAVQAEIDRQLKGGKAVAEQWKVDLINKAKSAGLLTGDHDPEESVPMWVVCRIALAVLEKGGIKQ